MRWDKQISMGPGAPGPGDGAHVMAEVTELSQLGQYKRKNKLEADFGGRGNKLAGRLRDIKCQARKGH